ncbi:MAG: hypothetical protein HKP58_00640 [Desulfatitalea sp.]|nr:hypothetical protein [Desulfatitalea sp.]NNJ98897.1 hypothetical protein [Desulfatitalea sp.]
MTRVLKNLFIIFAVAVCFITAQNVSADTTEVSGVIAAISTHPNMVDVDGTEVYGIKFNYLCNQYGICLEVGETVSLTAYEFTCSDGTIKLMATSITVGDVTVQLR